MRKQKESYELKSLDERETFAKNFIKKEIKNEEN